MSKPKCKHCGEKDLHKLLKGRHTKTGFVNVCRNCYSKIRKEVAMRKKLQKLLLDLKEVFDHEKGKYTGKSETSQGSTRYYDEKGKYVGKSNELNRGK
jgi:hypothetical protein